MVDVYLGVMNDRGEEALARKIYLELLSKENLEVIEPQRSGVLVRKALQLAAVFREATRTPPLEAPASAQRRSRPAPESIARREERRMHDRELTPASTLLRRQAPLAELKAANEPQSSRSGLKPIRPQPLE
jgi:hypothetical protein